MEWKDIGKTIGKIAPLLGTALGTPAVGGVIGLVCEALGLDADSEPEKVLRAIQSDPAAVVKLKELELNSKAQLQRLILASEQAHLEDRQNARQREINISKATGGRDIQLYILAWVNVVGFFGTVITVIAIDLPVGEVAKSALLMLLGALIASYKDVIGYFFGSSKSSSDKTKLMAATRQP